MSNKQLIIRAIRTFQAENTQVFSFFVPADRLADIAELSQNQPKSVPDYFNKAQPKAQIGVISEYINQSAILFPSALVLALSSDVEF
ncbi:ParB N-terminal domain-containing protein, partial [Candidatus Venteria ishoeyi]|uniref:hypothetical protein n=1 Tax=Candidatus Venteria ishoeyi TaxID=1899563 RepID=UPI00255CD7B8